MADTNRDVYASSRAVSILERDAERGLSEVEAEVIETYFDDGARILDVGCGAGRTTGPLVERGYEVVAIDVESALVTAAMDNEPTATYGIATATDLPFGDCSFEGALFSYRGIDYLVPLERRISALAELYRVLAPGGTFLFSAHNPWYALPAVVLDWDFLREWAVTNGNVRRLSSRYRVLSERVGPLETCFTSPIRQSRELRRTGFELDRVVGRRDGVLRLFEASPYYVARKPGE